MFAVAYVALVAVLAYQLRTRVRLLDGFSGVFRYFFSLGLTLFLVDWLDFLLYVALGWGWAYLAASWAIPLGAAIRLAFARSANPPATPLRARLQAFVGSEWDFACLFVFFLVLARFYAGLDFDGNGGLWSAFNFDDTAFHLSVTNALLNASRFPPMDLDMAPYPLKYHFLVDFWLAHLQRLGVRAVFSVQAVNFLSAAILVGTLWAALKKWLGLPSRWIMLGCLIFFFCNLALINVIHYLAFKPPYLRPAAPLEGFLLFPYFNFESALISMFSPQRGLVFTFPIALLMLDAVFAGDAEARTGREPAAGQVRTLEALVLACLLPFSHVVTFAVMGLMLVPRLWAHRRWLVREFAVWLPALVLVGLQLLYLGAYGPAVNDDYSAWDVDLAMPLREFAAVPAIFRRALFWFFVDGDFLFWGALFAAIAWLARPGGAPAAEAPPGGAPPALRGFLRRWRWYFAVCGLVFLGVNVYRYSADWGDSNKFILFLNLGLSMVIVLGAAELRGRFGRPLSRAIWVFFLVLCAAPALYRMVAGVTRDTAGVTLLFHSNDREAARWLRTSTNSSDLVLTGASDSVHFVTALGARPVPAGIYSDSNPYWRANRADEIRRVYEDGDLRPVRQLGVRYVCVSRFERLHYRVNPCWRAYRDLPGVVAFHAGNAGDPTAVYIFDAQRLLQAAAAASGGAGAGSAGSHGQPRPAGR